MGITQFTKTLCLGLITIAFNLNATPTEKSINKENPIANKFSKSCSAIESERDKKRRLHRGRERQDLFVHLNSFSSYDEGSTAKMSEGDLIYSFAFMGIISIEMQTAFTPMLLGFCNKEAAANNKCNYEMGSSDDGQIIIETKWKNAMQYTMTQSVIDAEGVTKRKAMTISSELPNYWNGEMTLYEEDGSKSEIFWSRSADGTENYHSETVGVAKSSRTKFTEYPNCSADIEYINGDIKITANWTLDGAKTTGSFKYCNENGCNTGDW